MAILKGWRWGKLRQDPLLSVLLPSGGGYLLLLSSLIVWMALRSVAASLHRFML